jgi:hypothetical protein
MQSKTKKPTSFEIGQGNEIKGYEKKFIQQEIELINNSDFLI